MATFDAEGARKAGYSEAEIQGAQKALEAGYTPEEIQAHLSGAQPEAQRYQTWPERLVRGAIGGLVSGATLPGDVAGGNQMLTEENVGNLSPGGFMVNPQRTLDLAAMGPISPAARAGEAAIPGVGTNVAKVPAAEVPVPTRPELKTSYNARYEAARDSGLSLDSRGVGSFGTVAQQKRIDEGFSGGRYGTAPKTMDVLDALQSGKGTVSASGLDAIRKRLGKIARETNDGKPTEDAAAATATLQDFRTYTESIPPSHILAGDPEAYLSNTKLANQDYMAAQQLRDAENRTNAAKTNYEGSIAARLDNQLKAQFRPILKSEAKQRGLTEEQVAAVDSLNKGSLTQQAASQLGRFTPFSPVGFALHAASALPAALATGGGSIIPQVAAGLFLHGARKLGEGLAMKQAKTIADLAAKRSALFDQRMAERPSIVPGLNRNASLLRTLLLNFNNQGSQ